MKTFFLNKKDQLKSVSALANHFYNINCEVKPLAGEEDLNFLLETTTGEKYLLKISITGFDKESIDFQLSMMDQLSILDLPFSTPSIIKNKEGKVYNQVADENGDIRIVRLHSWVPGRMIASVNPMSKSMLTNWGATAGAISKAMENYDHPFAHRSYKWNPSEVHLSKPLIKYIDDASRNEILQYCWDLFDSDAAPILSSLRKGVNHNDLHYQNVITDTSPYPKVTGIIDLGDAMYTEVVCELAIAAAYGAMDKEDPIRAIAHMVKGYHEVYPLQDKELKVLFPLILSRLSITATNAAYNRYLHPENKYLTISEDQAWELLHKLRNISPNLAYYTWRNACNLEPVPNKIKVCDWLKNQKINISQIVLHSNKKTNNLDLSVGSLTLGNNTNFDNKSSFNKLIKRWHEDTETDIGHGGYLEARPVYTTDPYKTYGNDGPQWRTTHLGLDIWSVAQTEVYAPIDGVVHSYANNDADRDYGPTIILEHKIDDSTSFYTLYGHLSTDSILNIEVGQHFIAGYKIGAIGMADENGGWPPHLHFQIILDLLENKGDFPGVAYPHELDIWKSINPDPYLLFPILKPLNKDISQEEIYSKRKESLGYNLSLSYDDHLHIVRGYKQYLFDINGRRYLDTVNNVAHVGHEHPRVVNAAKQQSAVLNTNTRYLHKNIVNFAESLLDTFPNELCVAYFVNSGSEANELALRMMEAATGQKDILALEIGYHGNTNGTIDISSYKFDGKGGQGCPPHTHILPMPDTYRGIIREKDNAGKNYANFADNIIQNIQSQGRGIKGFIGESVLSCGGQIPLPEGYLKHLYKKVRDAGGLCVSDEVQVGFGRVGNHFWGFELQGVVPDIVTMGKPIGNGHPMAAVVTTKKVADAFTNGMEYFNTFGGNPVSCAIGHEVLKIIKDEGLQSHALKMGTVLREGLLKLQDRFEIIGDVRGYGLFQGFELVKNRVNLEPAAEQTNYLANRMRQRGFLMSTDGPLHNVIKIKPPMCITQNNVEELLSELEIVLGEDFMKVNY